MVVKTESSSVSMNFEMPIRHESGLINKQISRQIKGQNRRYNLGSHLYMDIFKILQLAEIIQRVKIDVDEKGIKG